MTKGEALAAIAVHDALRGDEKHLIGLLKRVWPVVAKAELSGPDGGPITGAARVEVDLSVYSAEERAQLVELAHRQNGKASSEDSDDG